MSEPPEDFLGISVGFDDDRAEDFDLEAYFAIEPDDVVVNDGLDDAVDVELKHPSLNTSVSISAHPNRWRELVDALENSLPEVPMSEGDNESGQEAATEPAAPADAEDDQIPAHDDPDALAAAYERHGGVIADAAEEFDLGYHAIRNRLIEHGIHEATSYGIGDGEENEADEENVEEDGPSKYVIENPEGYFGTFSVSRGTGVSTATKELTQVLDLEPGEEVAYWRQDGTIHVVGPDGPSPPARADFVRTAKTRRQHNRCKVTLQWGPLKAIGATDGGDVKLFDRDDRVVVRAVDQDGQLLGDEYESETDSSPLAPDDSPHKYSTGREPTRFVDHGNLEEAPSLENINVDVPDGVTPWRVQGAVRSGECQTIDDVCEFIGIEVDGNGHPVGAMREVLQRLDLYDELLDPEGDRRQRGRSDA